MAKTPNYTEDQTNAIVARYVEVRDSGASYEERQAVVNELAEEFGRKPRSIVAKLSRESVYVAKEVVSKVTGDLPAKKEEMADMLREFSGLKLVGVEKANKTALAELIAHFRPAEETEDGEAEDGEADEG